MRGFTGCRPVFHPLVYHVAGPPLTIQFENTSTYSTTFLWEFGDGAVSNKHNPEYTYYEPGKYKIKLTAWGEGGTDTY